MKRTNRARPEPRPLRLTGTTRDERAVAGLLSELPDAAPDDLVVERVWRRLQSPEPGPSPGWRWAAASALAFVLLIGAGLFWLTVARPRAQVLLTEGGVFQGGQNTTWVPARRGDGLAVDTMVRSDASGRTVLRLPEVASLMLGPNADLALDRLAGATVLRLEAGTVTARVTKRPADSPFAVRAGPYTVTVVGTLFSVSEASDGRVAVNVREGVVEVSGRGNRWRVAAGQRWSSEAPTRPTVSELTKSQGVLLNSALFQPPSSDLAAMLQQLGQQGPPAAPVATLPQVVPPTAHALAAPASETGVIPSKSAVIPSEVEGPHSRSQSPHENTSAHRSKTAAPRPVLARNDPTPPASSFVPPVVVLAPEQPAAASPPPTPAPAPAVAAPVPARDFYAEALNLARHGEHQKAAATLEQALATGDGPRDLELYQLALLRQRHLQDPQGALTALQSYRTQFPAGALRQEVDLSIVAADVALGHEEAALGESAHFLAQHPQSERADEVRVLRGDLMRQHGDCAHAADEYRAVRGGAPLDDALYYWAYCQRQLGNNASATAALRDYLTRFPSGHHVDAAHEALGQ